MEPRFYSSVASQIYVSLWNKYRPVILQLMVGASEGPQEYKFFDHEFKALNPVERKGYAFNFQAYQSRSLTNIKTSASAQDLLHVLANSKKASELMDANTYEFTLNKQFIFTVKIIPSEAGSAEEGSAE